MNVRCLWCSTNEAHTGENVRIIILGQSLFLSWFSNPCPFPSNDANETPWKSKNRAIHLPEHSSSLHLCSAQWISWFLLFRNTSLSPLKPIFAAIYTCSDTAPEIKAPSLVSGLNRPPLAAQAPHCPVALLVPHEQLIPIKVPHISLLSFAALMRTNTTPDIYQPRPSLKLC